MTYVRSKQLWVIIGYKEIFLQEKPQNSASTKPKLIPSNKIKKENPTEIPCPECGILFSSQYQVNEHIKYLHQNRRKCDQCDIICHGKRALNAHKKTHDSRLKTHDSAEYHCEDCNTVCKSKQALRWHKQKSHGYKIFNCKCPMCEATFSNGWSLYWHKKREHGVLKKEQSYETQEKATHNVESFASPKLSLSDDSSADILHQFQVYILNILLLHSFLNICSRHQCSWNDITPYPSNQSPSRVTDKQDI